MILFIFHNKKIRCVFTGVELNDLTYEYAIFDGFDLMVLISFQNFLEGIKF